MIASGSEFFSAKCARFPLDLRNKKLNEEHFSSETAASHF